MQRNLVEQAKSTYSYTTAYCAGQSSRDSLRMELSRLREFGRVLYVGAHPDDENNKLIAYLTKELFLETAYLSITRGEGGQNFIGAESGEELGVLRVQESLQARLIDGGKQFFTRAKDYGFSKNANQTMSIWGEEQLLEDMVYVIRYFQPDVIISRFSPEVTDRHGHHQASAILIKRAFDLAAKTEAFSDQLQQVAVFQAKQLLWNVYAEAGVKEIGGEIYPTAKQHPLFIPARNSVSNQCYAALAAASRNQHRCQAMASLATRSASFEYFEWIAGEPIAADGVFRFDANSHYTDTQRHFSEAVSEVGQAVKNDLADAELAKRLLDLLKLARRNKDDLRMQEKCDHITQLLIRVLGLEASLSLEQSTVCPGERVKLDLRMKKQTRLPIHLRGLNNILDDYEVQDLAISLSASSEFTIQHVVSTKAGFACAPWLKAGSTTGRYLTTNVADVTMRTTVDQLTFNLHLDVLGELISIPLTVLAGRSNDLSFLKKTPVIVSPPVYGTFAQHSLLITNDKPANVELLLQSVSNEPTSGRVRLTTSNDLHVYPAYFDFTLQANEALPLSFSLQTANTDWTGEVGFEIAIGDMLYQDTAVKIDYPHIVQQHYFKPGRLKVAKSSVDIAVKKIAYIKSKDDTVAKALREIVAQVDVLDVTAFLTKDLQQYEAIVLGARLYNCAAGCNWHFDKKLRTYVEAGGVVIGQYNTDYDLDHPSVGPYAINLSANRITNAASSICFLQTHALLSYPNALHDRDFAGWSHDRALFIPTHWDSDFKPLIRSADNDGAAEDGLLLVAKKGKGYYVYTALSLFRQLPLAVPGAYRLFANMLSLRG